MPAAMYGMYLCMCLYGCHTYHQLLALSCKKVKILHSEDAVLVEPSAFAVLRREEEEGRRGKRASRAGRGAQRRVAYAHHLSTCF